MATRPTVSIIVPCFNAAATLTQTLQSIARQTYPDWEALCVDDESTDQTRDLLKAQCDRDPRFRCIFASHGGLARTRNRGLRAAWGRWVLFLDADDILRPDALQTLLTVAEQRPDHLVAGGYELLDARGNPLGVFRFPSLSSFCVDELLLGNRFSVTTLAPRELLLDHPFDEHMTTACEDWNLWLELAAAGTACTAVRRVIFGYRLRSHSLGHRPDLAYRSGREALERWLPHAADPGRVRDALHRWAAACGARAFAAGRPDALKRYWRDLPAVEPAADFPDYVAAAIAAADEFVHGAAGRDAASSLTDDRVLAWLADGPLAPWASSILVALHRRRDADRAEPLAALRDLVSRRRPRRLVIYGLGQNGSTLLEHIRRAPDFRHLALAGADDHCDELVFAVHGLPREHPRRWTSWPPDTAVVVTPDQSASMCAALRHVGGRPGEDFIALSNPRPTRSPRPVGFIGPVRFAPQAPGAGSSTPDVDVSVIIACRDAAETLADAIASVQVQTCRHWELVCIDDGSRDQTPDLLRSLCEHDPRIRWQRLPRSGQAAAKNAGLRLARGRWILYLDADDLLRPEALETLVSAAPDDTRTLVAGGWELLDARGRPLDETCYPVTDGFTVDRLLLGSPISIVTLIPRPLLPDQPFDTSLPTCIDWDLWLRLAARGARCQSLPRLVFSYRLHAQALSRRTDTVFRCGRRVILRWLPVAKSPPPSAIVLWRWAVAQAAMALAAGDPRALDRYAAELPSPPRPDQTLCAAFAGAIHHAYRFVRGADGQRWTDNAAPWLTEIQHWLLSGPLCSSAGPIIERIRRQLAAADPRRISDLRHYLLSRPQRRRVVLYGLGANGIRLLEQLRCDPDLAPRIWLGADDHAPQSTFERLGLTREDPRRWNHWPSDTTVVVTPNQPEPILRRLRAIGGRKGRDYYVLAAPAASPVADRATTTSPRPLALENAS